MLGDRYRLDERIAAGGMGEVWQATDTVLGRAVAVKTLLDGRAGEAGFQERFRHEARVMASLRHQGVAAVYDFGSTDDAAYLVMAKVDGQPLHQRLAERGRLGAEETMSIVAQAGRALNAAHAAGIVHRDVKPGNLIIEPDGTVVLVDFGVARSADSVTLTGAKEVVGTALYMAPEQVSKKSIGPAVDVYALGAVAYHCLAGHPPFEGDNPLAVALRHLDDEPEPLPGDVPEQVRALITRALAKEPGDRFPSAVAMAQAADAMLAAMPASAMTGGPSASAAATIAAGLLAADVSAAGTTSPGRTADTGPATGPGRAPGPDGTASGRRVADPAKTSVDNAAAGVVGAAGIAGGIAAGRYAGLLDDTGQLTDTKLTSHDGPGGAAGAGTGTGTRAGTAPAAGVPVRAGTGPRPGVPDGTTTTRGTTTRGTTTGGTTRRRVLPIVAGVLLVLLLGGAVLALTDPFGFRDSGKPATTVPAQVPRQSATAGKTEDDERTTAPTGRRTTTRTRTSATENGGGEQTSTGGATTTATTEPEETGTTPAETGTTTTTAAPTETTGDDDSGDDQGDDGEADAVATD
ncbi:serine/threonine-protein kinase [Actinoplanes sp. NPDC051851]|uniref:serine/threonine-protein kinase n=1 Tax=Actinoplanes sp. NPDC051851 TaxID=3154753 RepID=UPI003430E306